MEEFANQYNYKNALQKMMKICSTQEKCKSDIYTKLKNWNVDDDLIEKIIQKLVEENFINEERYAKAFVNDKFKFNKWGKIKIRYELKLKQIDNSVIEDAIEIIDENKYYELAEEIVKSKLKTVKSGNIYETKAKLIRFAYNKGFEQEIIYSIADKILETNE